eukprot:989107_1
MFKNLVLILCIAALGMSDVAVGQNILNYSRQTLPINVTLKFKHSKCPQHRFNRHYKCNGRLDSNRTSFTTIYGLSQNHEGDIPVFVCNKFVCNALYKFSSFEFTADEYVTDAIAQPIKLNETLCTFAMCSFLNNKTLSDPSIGPGHWRDIVLAHHYNTLSVEIANYNIAHPNTAYVVTKQNLKKLAEMHVMKPHYFTQMYHHVYWFNWKRRRMEWSHCIYRMGGDCCSSDVTFDVISVLFGKFDSSTSDEEKEKAEAFDGRKLQNPVDVGVMSVANRYGYSPFEIMVPGKSEKHIYLVPGMSKFTAEHIKHSEKGTHGMNYKQDGFVQSKNLPIKAAFFTAQRYGNIIRNEGRNETYNIDELSKNFKQSSDSFHRAGRLYKQKVLRDEDKEADICFADRVAIGKQSDSPKTLIVLDEKMDFMAFCDEYKVYVMNDSLLQSVVRYCKLKIRLRRTYNRSTRQDIQHKLKVDSAEFKAIRLFIQLGFMKIVIAHLMYWGTLITGYQTLKQMTELNVISDGNFVLKHDTIHPIDVPKFPLPPEFIVYMAQDIGITYVKTEDLISHGFHTFSHFRYALTTYYNVYSHECWQTLDEKKENAPTFCGQNFEEHRQRELDIPNAWMIYNNADPHSLVWDGSMSLEAKHSLYEEYPINRGKFGYLRGYERLDLLGLKWNERMHNFYLRIENEELLQQCEFSNGLLKDIEAIILRTSQIGNMQQIIIQKGVYIMDDKQKELKETALETAVAQQLKCTQKNGYFTMEMYQLLLIKLLQLQSGNSRLISEQHYPELAQLFYDRFNYDYMARRLSHWGFYFDNH